MVRVRIRLVAACLAVALPLAGSPLLGRILTDDGLPLPDGTSVALTCGSAGQFVTSVDEWGQFEFAERPTRGGCHLEASVAGYQPKSVTAGDLPDDPRIALITLHRLGAGQGEGLSVTHLAAPPEAVESYHLAVREMRRGVAGDLQSVLKHLQDAVHAYPDYAQAWFEIGRINLAQGSTAKAIGAFQEAVRADPWFISPYEPLVLLLRATDDADANGICQGMRRINAALPPDCVKD